jgi:hypothetical protein
VSAKPPIWKIETTPAAQCPDASIAAIFIGW